MPTSDYTPTLADVAAVVPTRTRDSAGEEVGTFNSDTEPTDTEVNNAIESAVDDLESELGPDLPTQDTGGNAVDFHDRARKLAALGAAIQVELTRFPEQVATNRSPYNQLLAQYNARLPRLQRQVEAAAGGTGDTGMEPGAPPAFSYPDASNAWDRRRF